MVMRRWWLLGWALASSCVCEPEEPLLDGGWGHPVDGGHLRSDAGVDAGERPDAAVDAGERPDAGPVGDGGCGRPLLDGGCVVCAFQFEDGGGRELSESGSNWNWECTVGGGSPPVACFRDGTSVDPSVAPFGSPCASGPAACACRWGDAGFLGCGLRYCGASFFACDDAGQLTEYDACPF
jgi:hypothetical protein